MHPLVIGAFSPSVLLRTARSTGALAEAGLDVQEVLVKSSPAQFRSLLDAEYDAVLTSPDNVVAYRFVPANPLGATFDVSIVSAVDRGLGLGLYGGPDVTSAEQLRGATIAVDVATSGFAFVAFAMLESLGFSRGDYELAEMGSTPRRLEALLARRCDATMLNAGNELIAEDRGCTRLARVTDTAAPYLGTVLAVATRPVPDPVSALAVILRQTAASIVSGAAREVAVAEATSALGLSDELAHDYVRRLTDADEGLVLGEVDTESLANVIDLRRRYSPAAVEGADPLRAALDADSGLVATSAAP